jgi:FMNH2-dependent dimethyl sulfone monooxygenase
MQFGLYAPVPHVTVGSEPIARSVAGAAVPLPDGATDCAFEFARDVLLEADKAGFDIILFAERHLGADLEAWVLACAIAPWTKRIRSMVAVHPGLWRPEIIAKMTTSLDRITPGRVAINLVTGWNVEEHRMFGGDALVDNDDRYVRAEEFVQVLRGLWRETPYSHAGRYFTVDASQLLLKPATSTGPEIFTASRSDAGLDMIARVGDWWFVDFDKNSRTADDYMDGARKSVEDMRARAARQGRKVRFALNPFIAFGDNEVDAMERVRSIIAAPDADQRKIMSRIGPATLSGCIGTPDSVRARLRAFAGIGIELFLFKFPPSIEAVREIRDEVIIPMRDEAVRVPRVSASAG